MSAEASHRTLDEFTTEDDAVDPADAPKTYTARNTREWSSGKRVGTAPRNWVASMIRKFPQACEVYHTKMSPYRYSPRHHAQDEEIENHREETGEPGIPVDAEEFAADLEDDDYFDCRVTLGADALVDGRQVIKVDGATKTYEVHADAEVVAWTA